jgi:hypothetical protein
MSYTEFQPRSDAPDLAFYDPPVEQIEGEHGSLIRVRPLEGAAALTDARGNDLVLYRSRSVRGEAIAVSGIVALPRGLPPEGGFPVITWAHGTVGSADGCAPSRDTEGAPTHPYNAYPHVLLNAFLREGWAVVMTDYGLVRQICGPAPAPAGGRAYERARA